MQHGKLILAVPTDEIGIGKKVEPVVDVLIERTEQPFLIEGAAVQHLLRFDTPTIAEVIHEQVAHLPAGAHCFRDYAAGRLPAGLAGGAVEEPTLLLDGGKLRVS